MSSHLGLSTAVVGAQKGGDTSGVHESVMSRPILYELNGGLRLDRPSVSWLKFGNDSSKISRIL